MVGSAEAHPLNRKRLVTAFIMFAAFLVLAVVASLFLRREWRNRQATVGHREPLAALNYCAPDGPRPCFLSFNLDHNGDMLVTLQTEHQVPDFSLQIRQQNNVIDYQCHTLGRFLTTVLCSGKTMPVGETLQFVLITKADRRLIAEGQLPLIGLALATPEPATTPTSIPVWERPPR